MKKLLTVMVLGALLCSCMITTSTVKTAEVPTPIVSLTAVTLDVEPTPITYVYEPNSEDAKALTIEQLVQNAQYMALKNHRSGDVLVQVSYQIEMKKGFSKKVRRITLTGYPATYKNFRELNAEDRANMEAMKYTQPVAPASNSLFSRKKK